MSQKLRLDSHLGLYSVFHSTAANRAVHGAFVPAVMISGAALLSFLFPVELIAAMTAAYCLSLAWLSPLGALLTLAWLLPGCIAASSAGALGAPAFGAVLAAHLAAWTMIVIVGHRKLEPLLAIGGQLEDSNYYFRQKYNEGRNMGRPLHPLDRLAQFNIGPMASTFDALFALGLFGELERSVYRQRDEIRERLAEGKDPFDGSR